MFNSEWLDIAIGVVVVWFLFSLVVSAINEGLVRSMALRPKQLWQGLAQLVDGTENPTGILSGLLRLPTWQGRPANSHPGGGSPLVHKLYATNAIQGLEDRTLDVQKTRIHVIPSPVFAQSMMELALTSGEGSPLERVQGFVDGLPEIPLKPQLQAILATAGGDVGKFQDGVERWFESQMSRLTGLYRSKVRIVVAVIGVAVSVGGFGFGLRSDVLNLVSDLQHDQNLRTYVVQAATQVANTDLGKAGNCDVATAPDPAACQLKGVAALKSVNLAFHDAAPPAKASMGERLGFLMPWRHVRAVIGVLLTGIAISFGSSFWYSILKRLVGLRGG